MACAGAWRTTTPAGAGLGRLQQLHTPCSCRRQPWPRQQRCVQSHASQQLQQQQPSFSSSSSNLGVLQRVVESDPQPAADPYYQRVSPHSFADRGLYTDGAAITGSAVLLVVLLGVSLERILGLDRVVTQSLVRWREARQFKRRQDAMAARQLLEERWAEGDDDQQQPRS